MMNAAVWSEHHIRPELNPDTAESAGEKRRTHIRIVGSRIPSGQRRPWLQVERGEWAIRLLDVLCLVLPHPHGRCDEDGGTRAWRCATANCASLQGFQPHCSPRSTREQYRARWHIG